MEKPWYSYLYIKSPIAKIMWGIASILIAIVVILALGIMEESRMAAQTRNWEGRSIEKGAEIYANNCYTCHGLEGHGSPGVGPALNSRHFFEKRIAEVGFSGTLEDYIKLTIAAGRPSNSHGQWLQVMPTWSSAYGGPLRQDQVQQATDYVMNWRSTAILQTPEEDPFIPFNNIPVSTETVTDTAATTETTTTEVAESRPPQQLFQSLGCVACHNLTEMETASNHGLIGPNMGNLNENAPNRVPGEDAATYVHNSIVTPNAHVVEGYMAGTMPPNFGDLMTPEEIDALVAWLLDPNREQ
ncbi:MAG: c-type cytochrome [Caldilineaceae bacterium]|nr:c-type cytochrome [Caldilineaceae bacterium]